MSDTYSYEVLEPGGHARLVGNVLDRISEASANPASAVGSSRAMLGEPETASWTERTTAADGAALVEAIYGNTIVQDGSLLPVRMEGIETVGFNQWDEQWELGYYNTSTGEKASSTTRIRCANQIRVLPNADYYLNFGAYSIGSQGLDLCFYDASGAFLSFLRKWSSSLTTPADAHYMTWSTQQAYGTTYKHDICINISDPAHNGTYEPHWSSQRTIPVATYFPDGLRSAGTVYDELRADAAVTRVGAVDLGTLTWVYNTQLEYFEGTGLEQACEDVSSQWVTPNIISDKYEPQPRYYVINLEDGIDKSITTASTNKIRVRDNAYTDAAAFKTAMSGVMLYYALATPTTTPIDPPLPLSYRTGAGGTERVMVASGTTSAPPVFATRYPLDPADLAASIAPRESATAEANHAVGDLIMLGFTLCKVTTSIARGEAITIGTNVTQTSVAAEIAALS